MEHVRLPIPDPFANKQFYSEASVRSATVSKYYTYLKISFKGN